MTNQPIFNTYVYVVDEGDPRLTGPFDPRFDALVLPANGPCPCGKRSTLADCCGRAGHLHPPSPARTRAKPALVRYRNPGCYLASGWDCARKLSREHFTKAILRALSRGGRLVAVTGHPWQREPSQVVAIERLTGGVLCVRHNNLLG